MRIRRRWVIGSLIGVGAVGALAVGAAVASPPWDGSSPGDRIIERAASILGIETGELENALEVAKADLARESRDDYLQKLVEDGVITQPEADEIKAWLDSMPEAVAKLPGHPKYRTWSGPGVLPRLLAPLPPGFGRLQADLEGMLDRLVEDGVIPEEKADELRRLWQPEARGDIERFEIRPFEREFEFRHHFRGPGPFGPRFRDRLPFEWKPAPEATPAPGT